MSTLNHIIFLRLFWVGHIEASLCLISLRLQQIHAIFFIDSSGIKVGNFLNDVFYNMINKIGIKEFQQNCGHYNWDGVLTSLNELHIGGQEIYKSYL